MISAARLRIAIVGTGISGLSAAWLLQPRHDVVVFEKATRIGGHSNTVSATIGDATVPVDTGFIVYNPHTYPNFVELLRVLDVETEASDMSFAASLDDGRVEYSGSNLLGLFGQPANLVRPRFWTMLADLRRFYREAPRDIGRLERDALNLGAYLAERRYGEAFRNDHILPMASAIWSATPEEIMAYPAAAFIRFYENHGLLRLAGRPVWRTPKGGSREYVSRLVRPFADRIRANSGVVRVERAGGEAVVVDARGERQAFDHVVLATHADEALALLADPSAEERALLGAFRYSPNVAVLHTDPSLMPRRRAVWSSWNYIGGAGGARQRVCVTYWMNRLQNLRTTTDVFVTLNPQRPPREGSVLRIEAYDHPLFDASAIAAQKRLWSLQGARGTWFCGAYFGAGFHEDGLQAGLAAAEQLGGARRPWRVAEESSRISLPSRAAPSRPWEAAA